MLAPVLPHEWVFSSFLLVTGARLFANSAARDWSFAFFGCIAAGLALILWTGRNPTPWRWRVRLSSCFVIMGISFFAMRASVPLLGNPRVDELLQQWDRALLGETPAVAWEGWLYPWLEDVAMAGYLYFFYYLLGGPAYYCFRDVPRFRQCIVGLFTMYGISFMSYTVLPAGGPHLSMTFHTPLHGPWILDWTLDAVNRGSNTVDVFPSVHVAASMYLLLFDWRYARRRFWWAVLPCTVLWWSTLYLRFHYFVDLVAGVAVALVGWWTALAYEGSRLESFHSRPIVPAMANSMDEQDQVTTSGGGSIHRRVRST